MALYECTSETLAKRPIHFNTDSPENALLIYHAALHKSGALKNCKDAFDIMASLAGDDAEDYGAITMTHTIDPELPDGAFTCRNPERPDRSLSIPANSPEHAMQLYVDYLSDRPLFANQGEPGVPTVVPVSVWLGDECVAQGGVDYTPVGIELVGDMLRKAKHNVTLDWTTKIGDHDVTGDDWSELTSPSELRHYLVDTYCLNEWDPIIAETVSLWRHTMGALEKNKGAIDVTEQLWLDVRDGVPCEVPDRAAYDSAKVRRMQDSMRDIFTSIDGVCPMLPPAHEYLMLFAEGELTPGAVDLYRERPPANLPPPPGVPPHEREPRVYDPNDTTISLA